MSSNGKTEKHLERVRNLMNEVIRFNRHLGLKIMSMDPTGQAIIRVPFREEFMGDPVKKIVHGGILSTLIDVTGGATTFCSLQLDRVTAVNTIDMRVDYLRPGKGEWFEGRGQIIRRGNRIVVTHIDVVNNEETLIATGTATYNVVLSAEAESPRDEWNQALEIERARESAS